MVNCEFGMVNDVAKHTGLLLAPSLTLLAYKRGVI